MQPPDGPPSWAALYFLPPVIPPPMSKMMSPMGVPMGTSTRPTLLTAPVSANTLVPLDRSVPMAAYQAPPFRMIWAILAYVSTLFRTEGFCHRPLLAGNGGLGRGMP